MKKADNFDASKWLTENKITTQSRLSENELGTPSDGMHKVILSYIRPDFRDKYPKDYKKYYTLLNVQAKPIGGSPKPQFWMKFLNDLIKNKVVSKDDLITFSERYNHSEPGLEGLATYLFKQGDPGIIEKIDNLEESRLNEAKVIDTKSNDFVQVRLYTPNDGNVIINKKAFVNYLTGKVSKEYKEELRDFIKYEFPDFLNNFEEELHDSSYEPFPSNQDVINQLEEAFSYFCTSRPDEFYNLVKQEDEL